MQPSNHTARTAPALSTPQPPSPLRVELLFAVLGAVTLVHPQTARAADGDVSTVVITGRLNAARESIQPSLGATDYAVTNQTIQQLPGADNQPLNQVVLQLPGVVQDGFGQLHVRDDHNNIQYRLNGVILPEGISVFGQTLSPRLIDKLDLITGAMPAQYGLRTAGVIDITTKSGLRNEGQVSVYGGSHGVYEPSIEYGGSSGETNYFFSGDYRRTQLGIDSPDGSSTPAHDRADELNLFGYADHLVGASDRVSLIAGYTNNRFQIPDTRGLQPVALDGVIGLGPGGVLDVNGRTDFPSGLLNDTQRETTAYAIGSYLHSADKFTFQSSLFTRYSTLTYRPDSMLGDLAFNGISQEAAKRDFAAGVQNEAVYHADAAHTLRAGLIVQGERETSDTASQVLATIPDADPDFVDQSSLAPEAVIDDGAKTQWTQSVYAQDEWKLTPTLTLNYGLRFDAYQGFRSENQLSPRINLVWTARPGTTLHAGYARYFSPPPFENVAAPTVVKFENTTGAQPGADDTTPLAERQNYYDIGAEQKIGALTLGIDAYYRVSQNLIDEGQFGAPIILTPFNYKHGHIEGAELSANYERGPLTAYANFAFAKAQGRDILSSQFNFDPADLAYIANNYIYLDHDQRYTGSAGAAYRFRTGAQFGADLLYGSGLRRDGDVPNGAELPSYVQVNLSASQKFARSYEVRIDLINAFDKTYQIRDGTGVGVGAPQFGPRRGLFVGLSRSF